MRMPTSQSFNILKILPITQAFCKQSTQHLCNMCICHTFTLWLSGFLSSIIWNLFYQLSDCYYFKTKYKWKTKLCLFPTKGWYCFYFFFILPRSNTLINLSKVSLNCSSLKVSSTYSGKVL